MRYATLLHRMPEPRYLVRGFPHLPEELWRIISHHMSTKDWARASGTCAALQKLQLKRIDCSVAHNRLTEDAVVWLVKHWADVSFADFCKLSASGNAVLQITVATNATCDGMQKVATIWETRSPDPGTLSCAGMCSLLERMEDVTCLKLSSGVDPPFVQMAHLKHLILDIGKFRSGWHRAVQQLHCLETLHIGDNAIYNNAPLTLLGPPSLKHLCCWEVVPGKLHVPNNKCTISVIAYEYILGKLDSWDADSRNKIRNLSVRSANVDVNDIVRWAAFELPQLEALAVNHWRPTCDLILNGSGLCLANLAELHAEAINMQMTVPVMPRLRRLCLRATGQLALSFDDAVAIAASIEALEMTCGVTDVADGQLWDGQELDLMYQELRPLRHGLDVRGLEVVKKVDAEKKQICARLVPTRADLAGWEALCNCRCCMECLARSSAAF